MGIREFMSSAKKAKEKRVHKVRNSWGVKDAFHYYRKTRPKESEYVLTECEFLSIIRKTNDILRQLIIKGEEIVLPEKMGKLELRKRPTIVEFKEGKLRTNSKSSIINIEQTIQINLSINSISTGKLRKDLSIK